MPLTANIEGNGANEVGRGYIFVSSENVDEIKEVFLGERRIRK